MTAAKQYHVIGLMSGSSLDGLDIAYCLFQFENAKWTFEIKQAKTVAYSAEWQHKLQNLSLASAFEFQQTNTDIAKLWATFINEFIAEHQLTSIDAIASHGHTIFHEPTQSFSTQIGNGAVLAALTQQKVICDFRSTDVALGGQGAPLVPTGDRLLFSAYDAFLNLGGISNIAWNENEQWTAFDISPCNQWLNKLAQQVGLAFDEDGKLARVGKLDTHLLAQLNSISFYQKAAPKSLSNKDCELWWQQYFETTTNSVEDKLHTLTQHIAQQIHLSLPNNATQKKCLVTGGGAFNTYLIEVLQQTTQWQFSLPDKKLIAFKEALIFSFLGVLRLVEQPNVFASVTGAKHDTCSGAVYLP
ncbi:MAG: hypothetical protein RL065_1440 [Bacteroidota bacterium]|jgi:anhydro-N-acetylmuramic acid kinase